MRLSEQCIKRPVLAIVLSLVILVLGVMGFSRLEIRFFPKLVLPVVNIYTYYEGASASLMESQVTTLIENALAGLDGVDYISSSSWTSGSNITIMFNLGGNLESEAAQVRDAVAGVQNLPADANVPSVSVGTTGQELMDIAFTDKSKSPQDIRDYLQRVVQPEIQQVAGVGQVDIRGSTGYAMRVWLDSAAMAARGITVTAIKNAITYNNIYFPAGSFMSPTRTYSIVSDTRLKDATAFGDIIVLQTDSGPIRLKDIANVELGQRSFYNIPMMINNKKGVMLAIYPLQDANPIAVGLRLRQVYKKIDQNLPPGMKAVVTSDSSVFLQASIHETFVAIGEAVGLVILIVMMFLGSMRAATVPIATIPISLIGVFFILSLLGFTINMMSLLAMVLAIGLVVDDAIVMLENIHRHIEEGMEPVAAAMRGSREIAFPIVVMCLTLVAVYAPIGMIQGYDSELFKEFAFTLAGAVVISGFVALTLSPMMCSRILQSAGSEGRWIHLVDRVFARISLGYQRLLGFFLKHRIVLIVILLLVALGGYGISRVMQSEFLPKEDYGKIQVSMSTPAGSSMSYTEKYAKQIVNIVKKMPQVKQIITQMNRGSLNIWAQCVPLSQRKLSVQQITEKLQTALTAIPGVNAVAYVPDVFSYGQQGSDIDLNFMSSGTYQDLLGPMHALMRLLKPYPGLNDLNNGLKFDSQEYSISINRNLAAALGVSLQDLADTVHVMMSGLHWTDVQSGNQSYPVLLQMQKKDLYNFTALKNIYVPATPITTASTTSTTVTTTPSAMVPLSSLITLTPIVGQGTLEHFDRMRSGTITALVAPGYTEGEVISFINKQIPKVMTPNIRYSYSGKAEQFIQSSGSMMGIMALAFVFIYLVLAAQFNSFIDPFIILFAVPLSMVGALFTLWLTGGTLNLYSQIGLVTLVGLISKHGILITQFINNLRAEGVEFKEAIVRGATIRLRPVLMTTAAMVFGALPLALASGSGSQGRHQIGWVIVGGLIFGTFFSLVVVPVAYSYLGRFKRVKVITAASD